MGFYGLSDVIFPHLGIEIHNLPVGISIFGLKIAFYGVTIALAMMIGYFVAESQAKRFGQSVENLLDFALIVIICSVIGARLYFVVFHWDLFQDAPLQIFNLRTGGLGIYGGVIVAILTAIIYCRVRKLNFGAFADVCVPGLVIGQAIGRWANFFNKEAFGKYTDGIFAMQIEQNAVSNDYRVTEEILRVRYADQPKAVANILEQIENISVVDGVNFIQAHPTFLYESLLCICILVFMLLYAKRKKFNGELLADYMVFYGVGRFFIEGLRTDQLFLWNTSIPISQLVSIGMILIGIGVILYQYVKLKAKKAEAEVKPDVL